MVPHDCPIMLAGASIPSSPEQRRRDVDELDERHPAGGRRRQLGPGREARSHRDRHTDVCSTARRVADRDDQQRVRVAAQVGEPAGERVGGGQTLRRWRPRGRLGLGHRQRARMLADVGAVARDPAGRIRRREKSARAPDGRAAAPPLPDGLPERARLRTGVLRGLRRPPTRPSPGRPRRQRPPDLVAAALQPGLAAGHPDAVARRKRPPAVGSRRHLVRTPHDQCAGGPRR